MPDSVAVSTNDSDSFSEGSNPSRATTSTEKIEVHCRGKGFGLRPPEIPHRLKIDFDSIWCKKYLECYFIR